jgi:hypothetical protein
VSTGSGTVVADGGIGTIDCQGTTSERRITLHVDMENPQARVQYRGAVRAGTFSYLCGGHNQVLVDPEMARF